MRVKVRARVVHAALSYQGLGWDLRKEDARCKILAVQARDYKRVNISLKLMITMVASL